MVNSNTGVPHKLKIIDKKVSNLAEEWDANLNEIASRWKFWNRRQADLSKATAFLIDSLDQLIALVEDAIDEGAHKKATVLFYFNQIYNYIVEDSMPFYLKAFSGSIKYAVINIWAYAAIDWMVKKYNLRGWNGTEEKI